MTKRFKYILFFMISLIFSNDDIGYSEEINTNNITIIATANVKGETDPCG
tara:strand:+ start:272 stop:421 length:150 start_codon:yes stop_codon:yes gene_type:complete